LILGPCSEDPAPKYLKHGAASCITLSMTDLYYKLLISIEYFYVISLCCFSFLNMMGEDDCLLTVLRFALMTEEASTHETSVNLPDYTAQQPRRQSSSYSWPWEPELSPW
jgi:hypothetical protein